jgi:hypothetical protein
MTEETIESVAYCFGTGCVSMRIVKHVDEHGSRYVTRFIRRHSLAPGEPEFSGSSCFEVEDLAHLRTLTIAAEAQIAHHAGRRLYWLPDQQLTWDGKIRNRLWRAWRWGLSLLGVPYRKAGR